MTDEERKEYRRAYYLKNKISFLNQVRNGKKIIKIGLKKSIENTIKGIQRRLRSGQIIIEIADWQLIRSTIRNIS